MNEERPPLRGLRTPSPVLLSMQPMPRRAPPPSPAARPSRSRTRDQQRSPVQGTRSRSPHSHGSNDSSATRARRRLLHQLAELEERRGLSRRSRRSRSRRRSRSPFRRSAHSRRSRGRNSGRASGRESRRSRSQEQDRQRSQRRRERSRSRLRSYDGDASHRRMSGDATLSLLVEALTKVSNKSSNEHLSNQNTLPEFDPARKEQTIVMWLHKVNECALIYKWTDHQTKHFALPKLKGLAKKWYEGLSSVLYTWSEWQEKLRKAFPCDDNYGDLLSAMLRRRARFSDSLEEYYYEKVTLLNRCGIYGKKAVDCIVHGIDDRSIKLGAQAAKFDTPDSLLPYLKSAKSGNNNNTLTDRRRNRNTTESRSDNSGRQGLKDRVIKCYNCSQEGHYKSQCTKPPVKCGKCMRFGHTSDKCETTKINENSEAKSVMVVSFDSNSSKYFKNAVVNGITMESFVDFGSSATLISLSAANRLSLDWEADDNVPCLRGFGNAVVKPLGKSTVNMKVDSAKAYVSVLIVPDGVMRVPLLIGQSFTEQSHILVEKDSDTLKISETGETENARVTLVCAADVSVEGLTIVGVRTEPEFSGDVYVTGGIRLQPGSEHFVVQGVFTIAGGHGLALVKGLSQQAFTITKGTIIARCRRATLDDSLGDDSMVNAADVLQVEQLDSLQRITIADIVTNGGLSDAELDALVELLNRYRSCFAFNLHELGKTNQAEMTIQLNDDTPVVYRPYRLPFSERAKVKEMIQELEDCGIVRSSNSSYASPIVLVKKKTGDTRLCVDYRALNRKTVKENYPLPRIDDQLDELAGYNCYTTLDLASGYYQIPIRESDRHKTAFVTPDGQFEFNQMPFGLVNAPSVFMRMINQVLSNTDLPVSPGSSDSSPNPSHKVASAYMDDIIIPAKTVQEGMEKLEIVLKLLQQSGLTLKLSKCCFFSRCVDYLGFELSADGIRPGNKKVEAVKDFPTPRDQHTVRQFIGLCSFFRRFVRGFSIIAKPLTSLLKKEALWSWGQEQEQAFRSLKSELIQKPILALYDPQAKTELHTDACKIGLAGILMQRDKNNVMRAVAYFSRQTTAEEQHMTAYELETLAVIASLQRFRVYLIGIEFKIFTDCNSLRATFAKRDLIPRVARWWIAMQEFNFSVEYRPGKSMTYVDALSRNPPPSQHDSTVVDELIDHVMEVTESDWLSTVQSSDVEVQRKISVLKDSQSNDIVDIKTNFLVKNDKLYRKTDQGNRWVVPKGVRWQILKQCHDDIGHFSFDKTLAKVKESYWFKKMKPFVKKYVASCLECAYAKSNSKKKPLLHPIPKDDTPFGTVHIDHVGPFVKSNKGNTHLLVIIDAYTKFIVMKPVRNTKSSVAIEKLRDHFSIFGVPKRIISDRGSCFTSKKFRGFMDTLGIRHVLNAVATPRANGQVERYNRTLLEALTAKCAGLNEKRWDEHVPDVQLGLNNTVNKGIGKTPAQALFGLSLTSATEGRIKSVLDSPGTDTRETIEEIRDKINEYIAVYQEKQKAAYDRKACQPIEFHVGDLVSIEREIPASGQSRKLVPRFQGPYRIKSVLGNDRYLVEDTPISRKGNRRYTGVIAVDKMKPWLTFSRSNVDSSSSSSDDEELVPSSGS